MVPIPGIPLTDWLANSGEGSEDEVAVRTDIGKLSDRLDKLSRLEALLAEADKLLEPDSHQGRGSHIDMLRRLVHVE